jgi:hypothetical protein
MSARKLPLGTPLSKITPTSGWLGILERLWGAGWPAFKRWKESRRPENRIRFSLEAFNIYLEAPDKGRADFRILLINFAAIPLSLHHVELHWWRLANRHLAEPSELLKATGSVPVESADSALFSVKLAAADIRDIIKAVEPSQNRKSAPRVRLDFNMTFVFRHKTHDIRVMHSFESEGICLNIPTHILEQVDPPQASP